MVKPVEESMGALMLCTVAVTFEIIELCPASLPT